MKHIVKGKEMMNKVMNDMEKESQEERDSYISEGTKKMNKKFIKESY